MGLSFRTSMLFGHHSFSFAHTCPVQVLQVQHFFFSTSHFLLFSTPNQNFHIAHVLRHTLLDRAHSISCANAHLQEPAEETIYHGHEDTSASTDPDAHLQTQKYSVVVTFATSHCATSSCAAHDKVFTQKLCALASAPYPRALRNTYLPQSGGSIPCPLQ